MSKSFDPDYTIHPSAHLREFVEQWQTDPARALACASDGLIIVERAQQMLDGKGDSWTPFEALVVSYAMGPNARFWQNLLDNHHQAVAAGKTIVDRYPWKRQKTTMRPSPMTDDDLEAMEAKSLIAEVRRLQAELQGMVAETSWDDLATEMTEVEVEVRRLREDLQLAQRCIEVVRGAVEIRDRRIPEYQSRRDKAAAVLFGYDEIMRRRRGEPSILHGTETETVTAVEVAP